MREEKRRKRTEMTTVAMLTAISCMLVFIYLPFPLFPAFKYELADVPVLIATFAFGPVPGIIVIVLAAFVQAFVLGQDTWMGFTMHVIATGTFAVIAGIIYHRNKSRKTAVIGLACGTVGMAVVMCVANYVLDPIFYGMTREAVAKLVLPAILPFNLSKAGVNSIVTFLIYKKISNIIHGSKKRNEYERD